MSNTSARPEFFTNDVLEELDEIQSSGITNMFGATPYLQQACPDLTHSQATECLHYWMKNYAKLHPAN